MIETVLESYKSSSKGCEDKKMNLIRLCGLMKKCRTFCQVMPKTHFLFLEWKLHGQRNGFVVEQVLGLTSRRTFNHKNLLLSTMSELIHSNRTIRMAFVPSLHSLVCDHLWHSSFCVWQLALKSTGAWWWKTRKIGRAGIFHFSIVESHKLTDSMYLGHTV